MPIKKSTLLQTELGNDPNDNRGNPEYLDGIEEKASLPSNEAINEVFPIVPTEKSLSLIPYEWLVDQFIYKGTMLFAGSQGVGKTTCLLPLALSVAGVIKFPDIKVITPRNVVWVAEDTEQCNRIIYGILEAHGADKEIFSNHFQLRQGKRLRPEEIAAFGVEVRDWERRIKCPNGEAATAPLVVIDTLASTIEMDSENDNSESSRTISTLREGFWGLPLWLVGHTSKASKNASVESLSARGASAFEADVQGVFYMHQDQTTRMRYLYGGDTAKRRDAGSLKEIEVSGESKSRVVTDKFGYKQDVHYFVPSLKPSTEEERHERIESKKQESKSAKNTVKQQQEDERVIQVVTDFRDKRLESQMDGDIYPNRSTLTSYFKTTTPSLGKNKVADIIKRLIQHGGIIEKELPAGYSKKGTNKYLDLPD